MEKYEISKEQVLELANWGNPDNEKQLKQWFPLAFKKEFEVGKVYKIYGRIFYCTEINEKGNLYGYGIANAGYANYDNGSDRCMCAK
jgi:hypothetical protein